MNPKRDLELRLDDILQASEHIAELVSRGRDACETDWMLRDALIHELTVVGEACAALPIELRREYPDVPWKDIVAMRNELVHRYFGVYIEEIWNTAVEDVPALGLQVESILSRLRSGT